MEEEKVQVLLFLQTSNEPGLTYHTILKPFVVIVALQTANFTRQLRQIEEFIETRFRYYNRLQIKVIIEMFFFLLHKNGMCEKFVA